jgi:hypothetical protein
MMEHFFVNLLSKKSLTNTQNHTVIKIYSTVPSKVYCYVCGLGTRIVEVIKVFCFEPFFYRGDATSIDSSQLMQPQFSLQQSITFQKFV